MLFNFNLDSMIFSFINLWVKGSSSVAYSIYITLGKTYRILGLYLIEQFSLVGSHTFEMRRS